MASNSSAMRQVNSGNQAHQEWTEEQLEQAQKQLKLLHIKLRELRTTVPRMLESLNKTGRNPEESLVGFKDAIETATKEINDFKALYTNQESKKVLEQAHRSRAANPKGIKRWRARDHPDWLDLDD